LLALLRTGGITNCLLAGMFACCLLFLACVPPRHPHQTLSIECETSAASNSLGQLDLPEASHFQQDPLSEKSLTAHGRLLVPRPQRDHRRIPVQNSNRSNAEEKNFCRLPSPHDLPVTGWPRERRRMWNLINHDRVHSPSHCLIESIDDWIGPICTYLLIFAFSL
jgi:hypothetical protein